MTAVDYVKLFIVLSIYTFKHTACVFACLWADDRETADNAKYHDVFVRDLGCEPY